MTLNKHHHQILFVAIFSAKSEHTRHVVTSFESWQKSKIIIIFLLFKYRFRTFSLNLLFIYIYLITAISTAFNRQTKCHVIHDYSNYCTERRNCSTIIIEYKRMHYKIISVWSSFKKIKSCNFWQCPKRFIRFSWISIEDDFLVVTIWRTFYICQLRESPYP